jgi:tetratricopeptide (TPR) repeat protein
MYGGEENRAETAEELFKRGVEALRKKESLKALSYFESSFNLNNSAECQSYLGLSMAMERGEVKKGLGLCEDAITREPENPTLYLNMGKLLFRAGRKQEAIDSVRKGLDVGNNDEALAWLNNLGVRRKPVFSFLPRGHFLNKYMGFVLNRIGIGGPQNPLYKF